MLAPVDEGTEPTMGQPRAQRASMGGPCAARPRTLTRGHGLCLTHELASMAPRACRRASIVARNSAKCLRPQPATDARITPGSAGPRWLRTVLGRVAMSSAGRSYRLLRCVIGPVVAVPGNLHLPLPMWLHQSFVWSNVAAPVWRPGNGPRPGRQRVKPHSCSALMWLQKWCPPGRLQLRPTCRALDCTYTTCAVPSVRGRCARTDIARGALHGTHRALFLAAVTCNGYRAVVSRTRLCEDYDIRRR